MKLLNHKNTEFTPVTFEKYLFHHLSNAAITINIFYIFCKYFTYIKFYKMLLKCSVVNNDY